MLNAVIVAATRTPIGRAHRGSLASVRADDLAVAAIRAALSQVPQLRPHDVDDLMLGCAVQSGQQSSNLARVVSVLLGWDGVPGTTVTRKCASSLQTTRMAMHAIRAGEGDVFISAGVESVSSYEAGAGTNEDRLMNESFLPSRARAARRSTLSDEEWLDPRTYGELPDVYIEMGQTAENVAQLTGVTRAEMDEFATRSQNLAVEAADSGFWDREITPITRQDGTVVVSDDCPRRGATVEAAAALQPAFRPHGSVTAGNSCPLNDGAAALVIMSDTKAAQLGIPALARIVSTGVSGISPEIMGLGPVDASRQALNRAGMSIDDVDLVEINEAFAAQVIPSYRALDIDIDKLNIHGGAIALGHPFGMTGARLAVTLLNALTTLDKSTALETMCVGGGQGMAMIIERLN